VSLHTLPLLYSVGPAFSTYVISGRLSNLWLRKWRTGWCVPLLSIAWTIVTVCLLVSVITCCAECRLRRMIVSSVRRNRTWHQCCMNYTGYQFGKESPSRLQCSYISACTACTWRVRGSQAVQALIYDWWQTTVHSDIISSRSIWSRPRSAVSSQLAVPCTNTSYSDRLQAELTHRTCRWMLLGNI